MLAVRWRSVDRTLARTICLTTQKCQIETCAQNGRVAGALLTRIAPSMGVSEETLSFF